MRSVTVSVFIILMLNLLFLRSAHAIIFLPAVILIPIAKLIAIIAGGFSIPSLGLGVLWHKLFKASWKQSIAIVILALLFVVVAAAIFFHLENPNRPWL